MEVVESVTTKHHFKHLMLPINIENRACVENKNQNYKQSKLSIIECASKYNLDVHGSGALGQGKANDYVTVKKYLEYLVNEIQCSSYFIGSKNIEHIKSNIESIQNLLDK